MRPVVVAVIVMGMAVVMPCASFAESTVGANIVVICGVYFSAF